uniref:Uncharacterized protein n=1 Tax=Anopheles farauti TaxID=69004 RepID=A0A182QQ59_9DIPT
MMTRSSTLMLLLLVRFLLMAAVLLVILEPCAASATEGKDSNSAVGSSCEMTGDESFEQDVSGETRDSETTSEAGNATDMAAGEDAIGTATETTIGYNAVATTPKIVRPVKQLSRYEQGLEDYDEAADRAEREQQQKQKEQSVEQQYNNMVKPMLTLFNVISTVLSSGRSMRSTERTSTTDGEVDDNDDDGGNKTEIITFGEKSTSGANGTGGATAEGRYIKGDPLNGYYDFVISEGSYKFWAVFQLVTAAVVIYSTLTAIYYSKVSPLTSDYDYIDYLNGGRSFAGARPLDEPTRTGQARGGQAPGWSWNSLLSTNSWFGPAAQAFTIVMDAIERQPQ